MWRAFLRTGPIPFTSLSRCWWIHSKEFTVQDIVNYISSHYPGYVIDGDVLYQRLFLLIVTDNLNVYGSSYPRTLPFVENESYIPGAFIKYIETIVEKGGNQYLTPGNMYNQVDGDVDNGLLYVMKQLAKPISRADLIANLDENLTVNRTTKDGYNYVVPTERIHGRSVDTHWNVGVFWEIRLLLLVYDS